jgi:hypothetical protein
MFHLVDKAPAGAGGTGVANLSSNSLGYVIVQDWYVWAYTSATTTLYLITPPSNSLLTRYFTGLSLVALTACILVGTKTAQHNIKIAIILFGIILLKNLNSLYIFYNLKN